MIGGSGMVLEVVGRWRPVLWGRTRLGRDVAVRQLELLAVALEARGWRRVRLYGGEVAVPVPLLWVYASGRSEDAGVLVCALATSGGAWSYYDARWGRYGFLAPCGDVKAAAERVDRLLKQRLFPGIR